jgi:hypothetical protein
VHALHSWMSELDFAVEPKVEYPDNDLDDAAFVWVSATIGGRDAIEAHVACKMYPLAVGFDTTLVSKVEVPLSLFAVENVTAKHATRVLAEVETEAERVLGSFGLKEYDALRSANILNGGRLNRVLEQMGVPYTPHPIPGSDASQAAVKK